MSKILKVIDPAKIVTDPIVLKELARQGIDKDYVEFFQDYASRSLGKEHSPYAKFYRDRKSNKKFMVVSGLPMVKPDGGKVDVGWIYEDGKYTSKPNLFSAIVESRQVKLTCLSDQPNGTKRGEWVTWQPQLFLDGSAILNGERAKLLPIDPVNKNYKENTLEWSYGSVCKRRIRIIEGRFRERWIFETSPHSSIRIKHNINGSLRLKLGYAQDAEGDPLQVNVIGDKEIVEGSEFDKAIYPVEIGASPETFYPDADPETNTVDGTVRTSSISSWATVKALTTAGWFDSAGDYIYPYYIKAFSNTNTWNRLARSIILFNTDSLPDDANITDVTLSLAGYAKVDDGYWTPKVNVYSSNPINNDAIEAGDMDPAKFGTTPYAADKAYADWTSDDSYTVFTFNQDGKDAINRTGITKLSTRDVLYDVGTATPGWSSLADCTWTVRSVDYGGETRPRLIVTYGEVAVRRIFITHT